MDMHEAQRRGNKAQVGRERDRKVQEGAGKMRDNITYKYDDDLQPEGETRFDNLEYKALRYNLFGASVVMLDTGFYPHSTHSRGQRTRCQWLNEVPCIQ